MKLIDLLVQELPKLGGWPEAGTKYWDMPKIEGCDWSASYSYDDIKVVEWLAVKAGGEYVKRRQYEAALAASKQVAWDGKGLPPVGCDVEFTLDTDKYRVSGVIPENGQAVNVVAHKVTTDGNSVAVVYWDDRGAGRAAAFIKEAFRPTRTEAERKREETIADLQNALGHAHGLFDLVLLYKALTSGSIRHITLK